MENNSITINGIQYKEKERPQKKALSTKMSAMMMMAQMMTLPYYANPLGGRKRERPEPAIDIAKEFELIQQKKSNLSRKDRDWVEWQFHRMYTKVNVPETIEVPITRTEHPSKL